MLNNDVIMNIYSYVGTPTLFLSRDFFLHISKLRKTFENDPVRIHYVLFKKRRSEYNVLNKPSTSCQLGPEKIVETRNMYHDIKNGFIGKLIDNKKIKFSYYLMHKIIPKPWTNIINDVNTGRRIEFYRWGCRGYGEISDIKQFTKYNKLWVY